jgi:putative peptidoglycan lipid II flippase
MISILSFLNLISILLLLTFQILLIRRFGAGLETDVYYLSISIVQFMPEMVHGFITELYIPFYNDLKFQNNLLSKKFSTSIIILMFFFSLILFLPLIFFTRQFVKIFASGFSEDKIFLTVKFLRILSFILILGMLSRIFSLTLNAENYFYLPNSLLLISPTFNIFALLFFVKRYGVEAIIWSILFSSLISFIIIFLYFFKKIRFKKPDKKTFIYVFELLKKNFVTRIGNNIWFSKEIVITNFLSYFPQGYITLFKYSDRILSFIFQIINSPIIAVFYIKITNLIPQKNLQKLRKNLNEYFNAAVILFLTCLFPLLILFNPIFKILFGNKLKENEILIMYKIFIFLIPFYFLYLSSSFLISFVLSLKKGIKILEVNIIFILIFILTLIISFKFFKIYALPISSSFSMLYPLFSYSFFVNNNLSILEKDLIKNFIKYSAIIFIIFLMSIFKKFLLNYLLLAIIFLIFFKNEIFFSLKFIFKKGEIK